MVGQKGVKSWMRRLKISGKFAINLIFKVTVYRDDKLVPPAGLRSKVCTLAHEGHLGRSYSKNRLRLNYWFPRMDSLIEQLVKDCVVCACSDKTRITHMAPLSPV